LAESQSHSPDLLAVSRLAPDQFTPLCISFCSIIHPSFDFRYNLAFGYGNYMHEIPRRLGVSEALDAAVATVVEAHSTFCSRRPATTRGLLLYSKALSNLRASLDDVGTACSNETLCAVMILMACQVC